ncbi:hypothetical protein [Janthinobacterium sp. Ant5-2-1]|uniref:hypothetical protein n=1 Tax=Janthinobacterium sp. Ant5-2-1 TaxID=1755239 RepID=UPI00137A0D3A|nr:hypothetical protein [Janthinobacterium sp. Ant5-2-1]
MKIRHIEKSLPTWRSSIEAVLENALIGTYEITDLQSIGIPGVEVAGRNFHLCDLHEMIGIERNMTCFMFRHNSKAETDYGYMVTGVLLNKVDMNEKTDELDNSNSSFNDLAVLRIDCRDPALSIQQRKTLKYKGVTIKDLLKISYATFNRQTLRHPTGKKIVPNIVLVEVDTSKIDAQKLLVNYLVMKHNGGTALIDYEKEDLVGTMLGMRNNTIDSRVLETFGFTVKSASENVNIQLASLNAKAARNALSKEELEAKASYEFVKRVAAIGAVCAELERAKLGGQSLTLESDAAKRILANAIGFNPSVLMHGKKQVFWDLQSYLHIVMRHIDAYQVGNFKGKTVLPYELTDLKNLIEKVLDSIREELALHFETNSGEFVRSGRMAVLFNGDYFILRIDPNGRLCQFYSP